MPRFTVDTPEVSRTAASMSMWAGQLGAARAALGRVEPAGAAADHPAVAGALAALVEAWSQTATVLDEGTRGLATNLETSASAYERTDQSQFPGR